MPRGKLEVGVGGQCHFPGVLSQCSVAFSLRIFLVRNFCHRIQLPSAGCVDGVFFVLLFLVVFFL